MPTYTAPVKDFAFLIDEFLELEQHGDVAGFAEARELVVPLLDEAARLCQEVLFPLNTVGDVQGLKYEDGEVKTPEGFKEAYQQYVEGGWSTLTWPSEFGGQDMPEFLNMPMLEMVCSANLSFGLTPGLTHGAISAMLLHANDELKHKYVPKMVSGEWSGVMCLTEPQSGTDLGLVSTRAEPNDDGSYAITGNKIFISSGEQDLTENIIHLVLARLPDAPEGTKGISLFVAPKMMVNDDGSLGDRNSFRCDGLEHKMGIHASPTCVMNYDGATGWLVGEPNKGLKAMFTMMNAARLYVGVQGLGIAEVARQNALAYAEERLQGRALTGPASPAKAADPITVHPDVRRMLWTMKAVTEGMRGLTMETALQLDLSHRHEDAEAREKADDFVQLMTPIVKGYQTDMGFEVASLGMQVLGGYGYIEEYGMAQYLRDSRIAMIYEGTNGVQAMDLVGRKLGAHTGRYLRSFFFRVDAFIEEHKDNPAMAEFTKPLAKHLEYLQKATLWIAANGLSNPNDAGAGAVEYARMFALVALGWVWARQAAIAQNKQSDDAEFYGSKLATARFYMNKVLPGTISLLASITNGSASVMADGLNG
ncbi:MAG: acyl-CoA dehydrogenase C-terminal domain-containing protein [Rickettsiales bacterium]|nr:acyl-CoA dehydrogenase C-terminal domain-containing protein [Rickettsiales bacterium]